MNDTTYYALKQMQEPPQSLATQVARELGQQIIAKHYPSGSLIEDESALAQRHQVSRSVVRDAVKILVGKGLLEVRRGIGTRIRPREKWGLLDNDIMAWSQSATPNPDTLRQLMEMRCIFEPQAARLAAQYGTSQKIELIEQAIAEMEREKASVDDFITADAGFHRAILQATENEFLIALEGIIFSALLGSLRITNRYASENEDIINRHRVVYEAILARDADAAQHTMQLLLDDTRIKLGGRIFQA